MNYREISPDDGLKPYIKCFYVFQSDSDQEFEDVVFPSGFTEIIFNLGNGSWALEEKDGFRTTPQIELWGQVTSHIKVKSKGKQLMLGVRFFPHTAGYFLKNSIAQFNDIVTDLSTVLGDAVKILHEELLNTTDLIKRIELIEVFLLKRLNTDKRQRIEEVSYLVKQINQNYIESNIHHIAKEHGISCRQLHKIIFQFTGLSPKSLHKINRFQYSLRLMSKNEESLTSVAYECGYFDQSHFIRDFKTFTGITPSEYLVNKYPVNQVYLQ